MFNLKETEAGKEREDRKVTNKLIFLVKDKNVV